MIRIPQNLDGARLNVSETADLINMEAGHFRRLVRRGVFPSAKRTAKGLPYYDYELLTAIADVIKRRVGVNGEEVMWYRRKPKADRQSGRRSQPRSSAESGPCVDEYTQAVVEACRELGVLEEQLTAEAVQNALAAEFGNQRPALEQALPAVARRLLAQ